MSALNNKDDHKDNYKKYLKSYLIILKVILLEKDLMISLVVQNFNFLEKYNQVK